MGVKNNYPIKKERKKERKKEIMEVVQMFRTVDGKFFDSREEARQHETELATLEALRELLSDSIKTGRVESVLRQMLLESSGVSRVLAGYRKKNKKAIVVEFPDQAAAA